MGRKNNLCFILGEAQLCLPHAGVLLLEASGLCGINIQPQNVPNPVVRCHLLIGLC